MPKYHLLCHASYWIKQYRVPGNFHMEEEKAMNSSVQQQVEHSNHYTPSKDLDHQFAADIGLKSLLQGGVWVDPVSHQLCSAGSGLQNLSHDNSLIQLLQDKLQQKRKNFLLQQLKDVLRITIETPTLQQSDILIKQVKVLKEMTKSYERSKIGLLGFISQYYQDG
ncbi:hypothetical protein L873DRAFT_1849373 [Choiromyces venosus 120613-1]|uniref:Uncharacterized protein n=1 Tax=Choiromyces venosus 120613-1 TaxID=1336337 RepID=A0A3N4IU19_9PEZI|nr:hypothetical protein L873DRAFT_1849373 [Choiromyces venosus 120613-1]